MSALVGAQGGGPSGLFWVPLLHFISEAITVVRRALCFFSLVGSRPSSCSEMTDSGSWAELAACVPGPVYRPGA